MKINNVYVVGDIHGDFDTFVYHVKMKKLHDCVIIAAGDVGVGFHKTEYYNQKFKMMDNFLKEKGIILYLVRGNHDDPAYFNTQMLAPLDNILLLPDYSVLTVKDMRILCIGGGISIDRKWRKAQDAANWRDKPSYWEGEPVVYNREALEGLTDITHVVTHSAPSFCPPLNKDGIAYWIANDDTLEKDINIERNVLTMVYDDLVDNENPLKQWVYGHFHKHYEIEKDGVEFIGLNALPFEFDILEIK